MNSATKHKVGVFDSGMGGLSVARYIEKHIPDIDVLYVNDSGNVPYGNKPMDLVYGLVLPILKRLEAEDCDVIVIACNTVTTNFIDKLRAEIAVPLIGIEPMVKQAAKQTNKGIIAVCATPATLASKRYKSLKDEFAHGISVLEPDCSSWSDMIESSAIDQDFIRNQIKDLCAAGADVIVLGCTHYHWIEDEILKSANGRALVIQPEEAVAKRLAAVLDDLSATVSLQQR